jgi:hypothetical protein
MQTDTFHTHTHTHARARVYAYARGSTTTNKHANVHTPQQKPNSLWFPSYRQSMLTRSVTLSQLRSCFMLHLAPVHRPSGSAALYPVMWKPFTETLSISADLFPCSPLADGFIRSNRQWIVNRIYVIKGKARGLETSGKPQIFRDWSQCVSAGSLHPSLKRKCFVPSR